MRGKNVFYPMGWDDNGLPTERRVQNLLPRALRPCARRTSPGLRSSRPGERQRKKDRRALVSRPNFIELCHQLTARGREGVRGPVAPHRALGRLAPDVRDHRRPLPPPRAALVPRSLRRRGTSTPLEAPTMWDVDFQTAVAQAEVEERPTAGRLPRHRVRRRGRRRLRDRHDAARAAAGLRRRDGPPRRRALPALFGKHAVTPLFRAPVPIFPSELVDPEKGTGILMVCTFGDATDVQWWREQKLALRQIDRPRRPPDRRSRSAATASPSRDPDAANAAYAPLAGKTVKQARAADRRAAARSGRRPRPARRGAAPRRAEARSSTRSSSTRRATARSSSSPRASGSCACSTRRTRCSR